jgi:WD40 repeat protein
VATLTEPSAQAAAGSPAVTRIEISGDGGAVAWLAGSCLLVHSTHALLSELREEVAGGLAHACWDPEAEAPPPPSAASLRAQRPLWAAEARRFSALAWSPRSPGLLATCSPGRNEVTLANVERGASAALRPPAAPEHLRGGVGMTDVRFFAAGPCCLAAASRAGPVWLADARAPTAAASVLAGGTGGGECAACLALSPDGWTVIGASDAGRVFIWDVRRASSGSRVMSFGAAAGGSALMAAPIPLPPPCLAALARVPRGAGALHANVAAVAPGTGDEGFALVPVALGLRQILLDPRNPGRLLFLLSNASVGALHLPSRTVTHYWRSGPAGGAGAGASGGTAGGGSMIAAAWSADGDALWLPSGSGDGCRVDLLDVSPSGAAPFAYGGGDCDEEAAAREAAAPDGGWPPLAGVDTWRPPQAVALEPRSGLLLCGDDGGRLMCLLPSRGG